MKLLIRNGHIIDPSLGIDGIGDVLISGGKIAEIKMREGERKGGSKVSRGQHQNGELKTIDATGLYILPGLVDMHTHLREPGFEYKETIRTGTQAAMRGGFTSVCPMPNTNPVNDNHSVTGFIKRKAEEGGYSSVFPIGAITKGQRGEELAEMGTMIDAGCVAFSDDGKPVMNSLIMRRALEYSKSFNVPIISHCEDISLSDDGVVNEGVISSTLGLKGIPSEAEVVMAARDIVLAGLTKARLHIAHVSAAETVRLVRQAKEKGIPVTAETCPHYFTLTESAVTGYATNAKVNPPLRTERDVEAIREGLRDGTIDVIATDHAPHHRDEKLLEFDRAPSGISGLETALSLSLRLVTAGVISITELVQKSAYNPAKILGIDKGTLKVGSDADMVILDMNREWKVEPEKFHSMGRNTPFEGWILKGVLRMTLRGGVLFEVESDG